MLNSINKPPYHLCDLLSDSVKHSSTSALQVSSVTMLARVFLIMILISSIPCKGEALPALYSTEFGPKIQPEDWEFTLRVPLYQFRGKDDSVGAHSLYRTVDFLVEAAAYNPSRFGFGVTWEATELADIQVYGSSRMGHWPGLHLTDPVEALGNGKYLLLPHVPGDHLIACRFLVVKVAKPNYLYRVTITNTLHPGQKIELLSEVNLAQRQLRLEMKLAQKSKSKPKRKSNSKRIRPSSSNIWTPNLEASNSEGKQDLVD